MKILKIIIILLCITLQLQASTITDMAGRTVSIPDKIERIMPYDSKMSILLYSVANEKMVARALLPGSKSFQFINASYEQMPEVDVKNIEELLMAKPQIIIVGAYIDKENMERFEKIQKRTRIPVVIVDLSIGNLHNSYSFLGKLLNLENECELRATFIENIYKSTQALISNKPAVAHTIYYTIGTSGLMTDPSGSRHTEVIDYMKLRNVAEVRIPTGGHAQVNMEQVLVWNPDVIFCAGFKGNKNAYQLITTDSKWMSINAVKNNKIYNVPTQPFGWFDHPPSVNRIVGIIWLADVFYEQNEDTTRLLITEFYKLFYKYDLTAANYTALYK